MFSAPSGAAHVEMVEVRRTIASIPTSIRSVDSRENAKAAGSPPLLIFIPFELHDISLEWYDHRLARSRTAGSTAPRDSATQPPQKFHPRSCRDPHDAPRQTLFIAANGVESASGPDRHCCSAG